MTDDLRATPLPGAMALALCLLLAACGDQNDGYPSLVPLETLLPPEEALTPDPAPALEARADALRARADALRATDVVDPADLRR